jgi:DnaJ-class molecular chaperone
MSKRDPYHILGVSRSASDEDIKRAYRKLARRHHPDLNNSSKASETRFKELAEAYEILTDSEKRRKFDMFGYEGLDAAARGYGSAGGRGPFGQAGFGRSGYGFDFGSFSGSSKHGIFDDIFSEFFRADADPRNRKRRPARGDDLGYELTIDFDQAYQGATAVVRILERKINVHIPAGVDSGSRIRVPGQGAPGRHGGPPGDLFLDIIVTPHRYFRREGDHVFLAIPITIGEAILGTKVEIPGPDGRLILKIPPGTQSGTNFRFKGKGFSSLRGGGRGDLYVTAQVVVPSRVDSVSRDLLAEFERRNPINPRQGL